MRHRSTRPVQHHNPSLPPWLEPSARTSQRRRVSLPLHRIHQLGHGTDAVAGCYECSQRRVNCDRGEPACAKCMARGLECSGMDNSKYRFRNRFAGNKEKGQRRLSHSAGSLTPATPERLAGTGDGQGFCGVDWDGHGGFSMSSDPWDDATTSSCLSPSPSLYTIDHIKPWQHILLEHCGYTHLDLNARRRN